jgi:hypothetical protein
MSAQSLESRLAALEAEVARIRQLVEPKETAPWWKAWAGAFLDDPYYEKAMNYGRQYRESLRPKPRKKRKRTHEDS